ncbi:MAG: ABC transporter permease [Nostocaceae cyanobacterium]|nr:ABC transporter permease [Nostocaceae cyanobacterium]
MLMNLLDNVGDRNPQAFRELKGRLTPRNILITGVVSGLAQFCLFQYYINFNIQDGNDWSWHIFQALNFIIVFTLLVGGTYLLINDLAREEHRGTLNFLRISPQSSQSLLMGKMLGVPSLLYLSIAFAVPFYLWAGISAGISLTQILMLSIVVIASCILWFSIAILFAFTTFWFSGFQAWLGSGTVLLFLFTTTTLSVYDNNLNNPLVWLRLWNPLTLLQYWFAITNTRKFYPTDSLSVSNMDFFNLPISNNNFILVGVIMINYLVWSYLIWQSINRLFRNPHATVLSKKQSYIFVIWLQFINFGFALQSSIFTNQNQQFYHNTHNNLISNLLIILVVNVFFVLGLMAMLLPQRQALLDWARYRHYNMAQGEVYGKNSLWKDLLVGEKSPAVLAMAINLLILSFPAILLIVVMGFFMVIGGSNSGGEFFLNTFFVMAFTGILAMIYTSIVQRIFLLANPKRSLLAAGTIASLLILPPTILGVLGISPSVHPNVWLFSTFPWAAMGSASPFNMAIALLGHLAVFVGLNWNLHSTLKLAGESETKVLISY